MKTPLRLFAVFTLAIITGTVQAADKVCPDPRAQQFDFWRGTWEVSNQDGSIVGHNRIEPILDGCVLQETWAGVKEPRSNWRAARHGTGSRGRPRPTARCGNCGSFLLMVENCGKHFLTGSIGR